jgi:dUTP pyrophosphatase
VTSPSLEWIAIHSEAVVPFRAYEDSVGWDLSAIILSESGRPLHWAIAPQETRLFHTGIALRAPPGHFIMICSRSGLATASVFVANAPGVVDPNYTGEMKILLYNGGHESYHVKHGDRIAQALVIPFADLPLKKVDAFPPSERGDKGFGSTGQSPRP